MNRKLRIQIPILCLIMLISARLNGQERLISKAVEEIQAGNFSKAEEQLESAKKKSSADPFYLFTKYRFYASLGNAKFNIDSAHAYLLKSEESLKALNEDQLQKYCNEYQVCTTNFNELKNNVAEQAYHIYAKSNSIASLKDYKVRYSTYPFINIADEKIDSIIYQNAESENTIKAFEKYLSITTKNIFLNAAKQRIQSLAYEKATQINSVETYKDYLNLYATPEQTAEIWGKIYKIAWEESLKLNYDTKYLKYVRDYPDSPYTPEALKLYKEKASLIPYLKANGKYIYVDSELLEQVINQEFEEADFFENNEYAKVKMNGKYGVINRSGKQVIECKYDYLYNTSPSVFIVSIKKGDKEKWGVLNTISQTIIPLEYDYIQYHNNAGWFTVYNNEINKFGLLNENGKILIPISIASEIDVVDIINNSVLTVNKINGKNNVVILDSIGKVITTIQGTSVFSRVNQNNLIEIGGTFFDNSWNKIQAFSNYSYVGYFHDGLIQITDKNSYYKGFADYTGNLVIPAKFKRANDFSEGYAAVLNNNDYWEFINKSGEVKIETDMRDSGEFPRWSISPFQDGYSWITDREEGANYFIKSTDKKMTRVSFEKNDINGDIGQKRGKFAIIITDSGADSLKNASEADKYGIIDYLGNIILPVKFKAIEFIDSATCWVKDIADYWRVFNYENGNFVSEGFRSNDSPHQVIVKGVGVFWRISNSGKLYYLNANFKAYSDIK